MAVVTTIAHEQDQPDGRGAPFGDRFSSELAESLGADRFNRLIAPLARFDAQGDTLSVIVPSDFHRSWLARKIDENDLGGAFERTAGQPLGVLNWRVDPAAFEQAAPAPPTATSDDQTTTGDQTTHGEVLGRTLDAQPAHSPSRFIPAETHRARAPRRGAWRTGGSRFRLDDFVVGDSNRLAYNAAVSMLSSERPGALFIHGACGVGKTHLLNGLAAAYREAFAGAEVRCVTGESFANEFIGAIGGGDLEGFRARYRGVDVLCVDDVHFLAGKRKTMSELLHTFDALDLEGAKLVLASDEHPKRIEKFSQRLVSRCVSGMVVEVKRPDRGLREEIARRLAAKRGLLLEPDAVAGIVERCVASVREIEGAVVKLDAYADLLGRGGNADQRRVTAAMVSQVLGTAPSTRPRKPVRIGTITQTVCDELGVELSEMYGPGRHRLVVLARSASATLARDLTTQSYPEIARALHRKNHSSIVTMCQRLRTAVNRGDIRDAGPSLGPMPLGELIDRLRDEVVRRAAELD
jgi:chromosomal replication initiator protein